MECLDDNEVSAFVTGGLASPQMTRVEAHLATCRDCRELVAAMAQDVAADSNIQTVPHEKLSLSQVTHLPKKVLTVGDRVGRYLILSTLGTGGMGVVFSAYDPQLDRKVALKLLRSGLQLATKDAQKRLRREAQAIAQLSHPNVVAVYDVGTTDDGDLYIAMEFVEGDTLTSWLRNYPRTWREIVDVFLQAGKGLVAAHGVGLLHRDFKPDHVLVGGDGRVRVTDFGLARSLLLLEEESGRGATPHLPMGVNASLTATGTVLGTPRYMAPEQLMGPDIDARADQFSFCVALFEALYGVHPLPGATSVSMLENNDKALAPPEGSKIPVSVGRAVSRGLEKDRGKRWPTMAQLLAELVPLPVRSPVRYAIAGALALAVVAISTAAVMAKQDRPGNPQPDDRDWLFQQLNDLKAQINVLNRERSKLLDQLAAQPEELKQLRGELAKKDTEIAKLVEKIDEVTSQAKQPVTLPTLTTSHGQQIIRAISDIDFDACFVEWAERRDDAGKPHTEARMRIDLTVEEDGQVRDAEASGDPSPSLRICLEEAIKRMPYPRGTEITDLRVTVEWTPNRWNRAARITGRRAIPRVDI